MYEVRSLSDKSVHSDKYAMITASYNQDQLDLDVLALGVADEKWVNYKNQLAV